MADVLDDVNEPLTSESIYESLSKSSDSDDKDDDSKEDKLNLDELFTDDKEDEEEEEDKIKKEKTEDEEDEEKEEKTKLKLDEEDEDELELAKIPRRAEIKAKYPNIFKEFPALDHIIGREKAYAEVFPTLTDARNARERLSTFSSIESELLSGKFEGVLKSVKGADEKAFSKITSSMMETLNRVDPAAHLKILNDTLKGTLKFIHDKVKGNESEDAKQLAIAAKLINNFVYNSYDITGPDSSSVEEKEDPKQVELNKERTKFEADRLNSAVTEVTSSMNGLLNKAVSERVDPKGVIPPYVKTKLVADILSELDKQMSSDTRFRGLVNKLWLQSKENGYSLESKAKIKKALREKASTILDPIIRAKKTEALRGLSTSKSSKKEEDDERPAKRENRGTPDRKITSSRTSDDKTPKPGESNIDFLNRRLG